jgi:hypothetical protein
MPVQTSLFFETETPEKVYERVFRILKPRTPLPKIEVVYRRFANANSFIRLHDGRLEVEISDLLEGAPDDVQEALAHILIGKLYRRPAPPGHEHVYRRFLNRADVRTRIEAVRQMRGRKFIGGPRGDVYDLETLFQALNVRFFNGSMPQPRLGWSRQRSRTLLGHYDSAHNAIILSRVLDQPHVPRLAVEYVMFHEMLHVRYPVEHRGFRRCVHTPEFKAAEKQFPGFSEAKIVLKRL